MKKIYDTAFKAKIALEAAKGKITIAQIASKSSVYTNQTRQWRNHLLEMLPEFFFSRRSQQEKARYEFEVELCEQIGQLKVELEWLKKISDVSVAMKRAEADILKAVSPRFLTGRSVLNLGESSAN